ncbi:CPBP family intramembrane glutamic endopeptidase [Nonomuraea sp. NPDC005983]|uniref:CPBP family intramembrane glutamic endopeptidase n=1 Tax=Nonomuraea sp. NPDC005983 TaxID=3155595 RepID=UPI0033BF99C9
MHAVRSPLKFFTLVFALAAPFWVVGAFTGNLPGAPMDLPVSALMFPCPLMAAALLVRREDGPGGVRRLLRRAFEVTGPKRRIWLAPTLLLMPAVMLASYRLASSQPLPSISPLVVLLLFAVFFVSAIGEEAGWTGYATGPLQERRGGLGAALILGTAWGAWHVVPLVQAHRTPSWIAWWFLGTVAVRVLIVWLVNNTGAPVLSATVFHATLNVTPSLLPGYATHDGIVAVSAVITTVAAALVALAWGPRTLAGRRHRADALAVRGRQSPGPEPRPRGSA